MPFIHEPRSRVCFVLDVKKLRENRISLTVWGFPSFLCSNLLCFMKARSIAITARFRNQSISNEFNETTLAERNGLTIAF